MFDCPAQSQTSPKSTSSRRASAPAALAEMFTGGPGSPSTGTSQAPDASATAAPATTPSTRSVTVAPGSVQPQSRAGLGARCSTA